MLGGRRSKALVPPSSWEGTMRTSFLRAAFSIFLKSAGLAKGTSEGTMSTRWALSCSANRMPLLTAAFKPRDWPSQTICARFFFPNRAALVSRVTSTIWSIPFVLDNASKTSDNIVRVSIVRCSLLSTSARRVFAAEDSRNGTIA